MFHPVNGWFSLVIKLSLIVFKFSQANIKKFSKSMVFRSALIFLASLVVELVALLPFFIEYK